MTPSAIVQTLETAVKYHQTGAIQRASSLYKDVLAADPQNADAWHLQGLVDIAEGNAINGESCIRKAVRLKPDATEFKANLAAILVRQNAAIEAEELCRDVLKVDAGNSAALAHLGTALRQQRRLGESLATFFKATTIRRDAAALCNLGSVLTDIGRLDEARSVLEEARSLNPDLGQVHVNLAAVLREQGETDTALKSLSTAQTLMPESAEVHTNRGNILLESGLIIEGVESYQRAIALNPESAAAVSGLGRAIQQFGAWDEAMEAHRLAAELAPTNAGYGSSYLYTVSLNPKLSRADVVQRHLAWGHRIEQVTSVLKLSCDLDTERPLRIGYVSPDLRSHATMRFLYPLLKAHDQAAFEIFLYSETAKEDATTEEIRKHSAAWCATKSLSDDELAMRIQRDRIDILVDLAGHTAENRLPIFARKPAPIQASFLGYPTTTGLARIDYFLTDSIREPGDPSKFFAETPAFLPNGACCFEALEAPEVAPAPLLNNGYVTFGSTHRLEKVSADAMRVWAQVLASVPNAKLLMFRDVLKNETLCDQTRNRLHRAGVELSRVEFGWRLPKPHLKVYSQIDILLDVFPWGSGTIAYDAMWMGVPVPTIAGDRGGCRATASMLHHCGFQELIAESSSQYVDIVSQLAADEHALVQRRQEIRRVMANTVCDGERFAKDIEDTYRSFWKKYVRAETCVPEKDHA